MDIQIPKSAIPSNPDSTIVVEIIVKSPIPMGANIPRDPRGFMHFNSSFY